MADSAIRLVGEFSQRGLTFGTAESLTAGMIASAVGSVSGASAVLMGGVVSYDERIKREVLGVRNETLAVHTVYSRECAMEMAMGARRVLGVDIAVSATGVAGPLGGTPQAPVGTVFIGVCSAHGVRAVECHFEGDRQRVREQSVEAALQLALEESAKGSPV